MGENKISKNYSKNYIKNLVEILDSSKNVVYVCDPDTYELLYVNKAFNEIRGNDVIGKHCYEVISGHSDPCKYCSNPKIYGENTGKTFEWEEKINEKWYSSIAQAIKWDGKYVRLEIATDVTEKKIMEETLRNKSSMLAERVKELNCLYSARTILQDTLKDYSEVFREIIDIIPSGWKYPEQTAVKITYGGKEYYSSNWNEDHFILSSELFLEEKIIGSLEIAYIDEMPEMDEGPFLTEERNLINNLALKLSNFIERKQREDELNQYKDSLEKLVKERTKKLMEINNKLEQELKKGNKRDETIRKQAEEILELSTPVLKLWDGVLASVLIGSLDSERSEKFRQRLLREIEHFSANTVIIDITGVPVMDTQTAQNIIDTISASKLMGVRVIITGVRPQIAQTIVHLGIDLTGIETLSSIESGLKRALFTED